MQTLQKLTPECADVFLQHPFETYSYTLGIARHRLHHLTNQMEFIRPYQPEDPPKWIDWRSFARTEEIFVREERPPVASTTVILMPHSPTWDWAQASTEPNKTETYLRVALYLTYLEALKSHPVLWLIRAEGANPFQKLWFRSRSSAKEIFANAESCHFSWVEIQKFAQDILPDTLLQNYGRLILVSDALDDGFSESEFAQMRAKKKNFLHILHSSEEDLSWCKNHHLYEAPEKINIQYAGQNLKKSTQEHKNAIQQWQRDLQKKFESNSWGYHSLTELSTITDLHLALE